MTALDDLRAAINRAIAAQDAAAAKIVTWQVPPITLKAGEQMDLAKTLPAGIAAGGIFSIGQGTLSGGLTLSQQGILRASSAASSASLSGIRFRYDY